MAAARHAQRPEIRDLLVYAALCAAKPATIVVARRGCADVVTAPSWLRRRAVRRRATSNARSNQMVARAARAITASTEAVHERRRRAIDGRSRLMHRRMLRAAQAITLRRFTGGIVAIRSVTTSAIATKARSSSPPGVTIATINTMAAVRNTSTLQPISACLRAWQAAIAARESIAPSFAVICRTFAMHPLYLPHIKIQLKNLLIAFIFFPPFSVDV